MFQDLDILDIFHFIADFDLGKIIQEIIAKIAGVVEELLRSFFGGLL